MEFGQKQDSLKKMTPEATGFPYIQKQVLSIRARQGKPQLNPVLRSQNLEDAGNFFGERR